ncbi:hypothetical protein [Fuchsiella alkaliacetigena]|uniref:hypothetical protein n=1 Tax=Fuchsiella alkaliacetigena TaxID=957042 RepID=UPI002009F4FB|nr:hypothetical protein [Fuchsiella alkaliacetigena]MCK8824870.1 hypothetical protein [Fuchsiella alkaliacetigena]
MNKTTISEHLNMLILSMASKQKVFNDLESELFQLNAYTTFIEQLIQINLEVLDLKQEEKQDEYNRLIELYFEGEIDSPEQIIERLTTDLHAV